MYITKVLYQIRKREKEKINKNKKMAILIFFFKNKILVITPCPGWHEYNFEWHYGKWHRDAACSAVA